MEGWERVDITRDRKSREADASGFRNGRFRGGHARRVGGIEVHNEADHSHRLERQAADSEPAHLDQPPQHVGRPHQSVAVRGFDMHAIVTDQPHERQCAAFTRAEERESER